MKKIIGVCLLVLFAIPAFAQIREGVATKVSSFREADKVSQVLFYNGWNLVSEQLLNNVIIQPSNEQVDNERLVIYGFNPLTQKYVGGDLFSSENNPKNKIKEFFGTGASFFVYLNKQQAVRANSLRDASLSEYKYAPKNQFLFKGWNFLSITPAMVGKRMIDFKGDCTIKKSYIFDPEPQNWGSRSDFDNQIMESRVVGYGFIVQVENNCSFSFVTSEPIPSIPNLPN